MKYLENINIENKRVLIRVDYNVPVQKDGSIANDFRIKQSLDSINYCLEHNASIVLMSHLVLFSHCLEKIE